MRNKLVIAGLCLLAGVAGAAKSKAKSSDDVFYVYQDKGLKNTVKFAPSGWMGDYGDLKLDDGYKEGCADGVTCIKWTYVPKGAQGANWAGAYWQNPPNNWGDKQGGYDIAEFKRLTFWAKSPENAKIAEFKIGGISGEFGDSDSASIGPVVLTPEWKKYTIDLAGKDLHHIIGGFCFSANHDDNPKGYTMYLDEIRYEK